MNSRIMSVVAIGIWLVAATVQGQTPGSAGRELILIDGSGSMAGFFGTEQVGRLRSALQANSSSGAGVRYFINQNLAYDEPSEGGFGGETLLRNALDRSLELGPDFVWIITDNQPSVGGQTKSDQDLEQFYELLRSDRIKRIHLFPLKLHFAGDLYLRRPDGAEYSHPYTGPRGLLVYALLLNEPARDEYDRAVQRLETALQREFSNPGIKAIFVKPLSRETLTSTLSPGKKLKISQSGGIEGRDFEERDPIEGDVILELTSTHGEIAIEQARVEVQPVGDFETASFKTSTLVPKIDPQEVRSLQPGEKRVFKIQVKLDSVEIKKDPLSLWNCVTNNRGVISGQIRVQVRVPPEKLKVTKTIATHFSTDKDIYSDPNPQTQQRIYRLDDLIRKMIPDEEIIRPQVGKNADGVIPVRLEVAYPRWPLYLLIAFIGAPLLAVVGGAAWIKRQPYYRLTWNGGSYRACPDFRLWPLSSKGIEIDGAAAANVGRSFFSGITVSAARDHLVDEVRSKAVTASDSEFTITRSKDRASVPFNLSMVTASRGKEESGDDFTREVDYGSDNTDMRRESVGGALPIKEVTTIRDSSYSSSAPTPAGEKKEWEY
jgi:hypothetical protein